MASSDNKRAERRYTRLLNNESTWLQKVSFALSKVEDAHEKLADVRGEEPEPLTIEVDGRAVELEAVQEAIQERAQQVMERVRERRRTIR